MSFLDNLENSLKQLESREERDPAEHSRREAQRAQTAAAAPWADKLKESPYTQTLMGEATRAGYKLKAKVYLAWIDTTLRLDLRTQRLELRPTPEGIVAVFLENNEELRRQPVDLDGNPAELVQQWLGQ